MKRNIGLDFLRGIAIILVLFRHLELNKMMARTGWIGVDLFFVLSGFLVSGLLFREYKNRGEVNLKRFFIRRGFKIYPSFYFFILLSFLLNFVLNHQLGDYTWQKLIAELLFVQNYFPRLWDHTWSIAIEEHFYLFLILMLFLGFTTNQKKFVSNIKLTAIATLVIILAIRTYACLNGSISNAYYQTQFRVDSLMWGVLISLMYHFNHQKLTKFFSKYKFILSTIFCIGMIPFFYFPVDYFLISSVGFTVLAILFAILLLLIIDYPFENIKNKLSNYIIKRIAFIGFYSYNIYLWHLMVLLLLKILKPVWNVYYLFPIYFILSIFTGWLISLAIEKKGLQLRDRYFPSSK
jgi:peptidoglycan/LPS O-acetylase OafA/YrhL